MTQGKKSVTSTATKILDANTSRRSYWIQNRGNKTVYIGYNSSVSTDNPCLYATGSFDRIVGRDYKGEIWAICTAGETSEISYLDL